MQMLECGEYMHQKKGLVVFSMDCDCQEDPQFLELLP